MEREPRRGKQELECLRAVLKLIPQSGSIYTYLSSTKPNPNASEFPDFVFNGGFIEHFQVTSARENRKGDMHNIAESQFEKDCEEEFEFKKQEFLNSQPSPHTLYTNFLEMETPEYSYDNFIKSFKRNFEHHVESLHKYNGDKSIGIFLIEHTGGKISVFREGRYLTSYKIRMDKELLSYLYGFADMIKCVIYFAYDNYEVIELNNVPEMIERVPENIIFVARRFINARMNLFLDW